MGPQHWQQRDEEDNRMNLLLVSLFVAAAAGQKAKPRPSWYIDNSNMNKKECERYNTGNITDGPIYIDTLQHGGGTGTSQPICIYFPPTVVQIPVDSSLPECAKP